MSLGWLSMLLMATQAGGLVVHDFGVGHRARVRPANLPADVDAPNATVYAARADHWAPFSIDLGNMGPTVSGTLIVKETNLFNSDRLVYRHGLTLAQGARKRISFPVLVRGAMSLVVRFEDDEEGTLKLGKGRELWVAPTHTVSLRAEFVLVATRSPGDFSHLLVADTEHRVTKNRILIPITPEELPDYAVAYGGVDLLVLDDLPLDRLSSRQRDAMIQYVARGGTLVVSTFRNTQGLQGTQLEPLLPGSASGILNRTEVSSLEAATGILCVLDGPTAMTTFTPREGAVGWGDDGVILHRRHGRGTIILCGFPISAPFLRGWSGSRGLFGAFKVRQDPPIVAMAGAYQSTDIRSALAKALKDSIVKPIPPFRSVIVIMIAYCLGVGVAPYVVFKRLKKIEWAWLGIIVVAIGAAGAVFGLGLRYFRNETTALRVSVVEGGAHGGPLLRHNFWAFFSAYGGNKDLSFRDPSSLPTSLGSGIGLRGRRKSRTTTISYSGARLRDLETFTQDTTLFETTDQTVLPGTISFRADCDRVLTARCDASLEIRRAWLVYDERAEEVRISEKEAVLDRPLVPMWKVVQDFRAESDRLLSRCFPTLLLAAAEASKRRERPVLVYVYGGSPALVSNEVIERGLDVGLLEPSGWKPYVTVRSWQVRRVSPRPDTSLYYQDAALYSEEGVELALRLDGIDGYRVQTVTISSLRTVDFVKVEAYDWHQRRWGIVNPERGLSALRHVHRSPQGSAFARVRVRVADAAWSDSNLDNFEAHSRLTTEDPTDD